MSLYTASPATIRGAELQLMTNPVEHLSADLTFGYNHTRSYGVDPSVKTQPEINMSGGVQYALPLPVGSITPPVVRNNSITRRQAPGNIRDAVHPRLMRLEWHTILRDDIAKTAPGLW